MAITFNYQDIKNIRLIKKLKYFVYLNYYIATEKGNTVICNNMN